MSGSVSAPQATVVGSTPGFWSRISDNMYQTIDTVATALDSFSFGVNPCSKLGLGSLRMQRLFGGIQSFFDK